MNRHVKLLLCLATATSLIVLVACGNASSSDGFDVVINNGRVMDPETGLDAVRNVGIKDGRIVTITESAISGTRTIDAAGHVVAPGFINLEQQGLDPFSIKSNLRDGWTSQLDFETGALNIPEWYEKREGTTQANFGAVVGQEYSRMRVLDGIALEGPDISMPWFLSVHRPLTTKDDGIEGWATIKPTPDQVNQIHEIIDEGLRQGALGVGSTLGYAAESIRTFEMFLTQKLAGEYGRVTSVHHRFFPSANTPTEAPIGVKEVMANAMVLNAPLQIHHDNDFGWWEVEEMMRLAREQGHNIWSTYYPWTAGFGNYSMSIVDPTIWEGRMNMKYEETIFDTKLQRYVTKEEFLKFQKEEPLRQIVVYNPARIEWLPEWTKITGFIVATDGTPGTDIEGNLLDWDAPYEEYGGHPRSAGSAGVVLRTAREVGVPLMHTLSQLSYWPAKFVGETGLKDFQERGRMQEGMVADIVVFDPENVTERATYEPGEGGLPTEGIPYVLVNGTVIVDDSKVLKDVYPGQPIRFPVEKKGRLVPLNATNWMPANLVETSPSKSNASD